MKKLKAAILAMEQGDLAKFERLVEQSLRMRVVRTIRDQRGEILKGGQD